VVREVTIAPAFRFDSLKGLSYLSSSTYPLQPTLFDLPSLTGLTFDIKKAVLDIKRKRDTLDGWYRAPVRYIDYDLMIL
jgi:hypothetical protein